MVVESIKNMFRMIILGSPGSGKGTISSRIVRDFGLKHLASGDILRSHLNAKTELGQQAGKYINAGKLVPDVLMVNLIGSEIAKLKLTSWLLDGFPRTRIQAEALHDHEKVAAVVSLEIPTSVIVERLKGRWTHIPSGRIYNIDFNPPKEWGKDDLTGEPLVQRNDDQPEFVKKRLEIYHEHTDPVKEFYEKLGILQEFHGTESNEIWPRLHKYLEEFIPSNSGPF